MKVRLSVRDEELGLGMRIRKKGSERETFCLSRHRIPAIAGLVYTFLDFWGGRTARVRVRVRSRVGVRNKVMVRVRVWIRVRVRVRVRVRARNWG